MLYPVAAVPPVVVEELVHVSVTFAFPGTALVLRPVIALFAGHVGATGGVVRVGLL
jgi:hypothetical protein